MVNLVRCMVVKVKCRQNYVRLCHGRQVEKNKYVMVQNNCIIELQRDA